MFGLVRLQCRAGWEKMMLAKEEAVKPRKRIEDFIIPKSTDIISIELFYTLLECVSIWLYAEKVHGKAPTNGLRSIST
jgi:hypothetical protein